MTSFDCDFIESYALRALYPDFLTQDIEHGEHSLQVVTYGTVCSGYIEHKYDNVMIVEVPMTRQNFQKLLNPEINQNCGVCCYF